MKKLLLILLCLPLLFTTCKKEENNYYVSSAVYGCTDASSTCNYDAAANTDDSSCIYDLGCGCGGPAPGETCACPRAGGIGAWELDAGATSWTSFTAEPGVYNIDVTSLYWIRQYLTGAAP